ncbi:hypothetical protein [Moraxella marmotae]|uniref:hypothetical protein n=1 Tax=Moraxella marmotae TaxID=3344520 RepID=UPI0035F2CF68
MKRISKIITAFLVVTSTISSTMAEVNQPIATPVTQTAEMIDLSYAFGSSDNLSLRVMTQQEMDETQGAAIWFTPAIAGGARFTLTGFTRHGLNQTISRGSVGVSNKAILSTMRNPTKITTQSAGRTKFTGPDGGVVLNSQGKVITTWGKPR